MCGLQKHAPTPIALESDESGGIDSHSDVNGTVPRTRKRRPSTRKAIHTVREPSDTEVN